MKYPLIRSYGRIIAKPLSDAKKELLQTVLPRLSLPEKMPADLTTIFPTSVEKICLDIGFGGGENLIEKISQNPNVGYIGSEVFLDGVVKFIRHWQEKNEPKNCLISDQDARDILSKFPKESLDQIDLFYPDPWHKARHHKRRMVAKDNLNILAQYLKKDGILRIASDIPNYIEMAIENINAHPTLKLIYDSTHPYDDWITTRYEQKALHESRSPHYLEAIKI